MHFILDEVLDRARVDQNIRLENHDVERLQRLGDVEQHARSGVAGDIQRRDDSKLARHPLAFVTQHLDLERTIDVFLVLGAEVFHLLFVFDVSREQATSQMESSTISILA